MKTILGSRRYQPLARVSICLIVLALIAGMAGCDGDGTTTVRIQTWYDLDAIRDNLGGNYTLMNDLDSTTAGYDELVSPTANGGAGWQPIGITDNPFTGTFDGQGYEIHDLFINRPYEDDVGLFGYVIEGGVIKNLGVVNTDVTGLAGVGGLIGGNAGTVSNSYSTGNVTDGGWGWVGGLIGGNAGTVSNSYSTSYVTGYAGVGGLVAFNDEAGTVSNSYSSANVIGEEIVGGLVAGNAGIVSNSYSTGSVTGNNNVGGLVGENHGTVNNSFWDEKNSGMTYGVGTGDDTGITGKSEQEMKDIETYRLTGWDIVKIEYYTGETWYIDDKKDYPRLGWQL